VNDRIWPAASGPAGNAGDNASYTMGPEFQLSQAGQLTGIFYWRALASDPLPSEAAIFAVTGHVLITTIAFADPGGSGWIKAVPAGTVLLAAGTRYKAVVLGPSVGASWYSSTAHYWDTGPGAAGITSGIITAFSSAAATDGQDCFSAGAALTYPASSFNATNYWIDVEVAAVAQAAGTGHLVTVLRAAGLL
jgi:Domain of unknown function (DUF4082)